MSKPSKNKRASSSKNSRQERDTAQFINTSFRSENDGDASLPHVLRYLSCLLVVNFNN